MNQIMSGGPDLIPKGELPDLEKLMTTPKVLWELYRLDGRLRVILARSSPDRDTFGEYGEFFALTHRDSYPLMTEQEGRQVLAWLAGEFTTSQFRDGLRRAIREHLDDISGLPTRGEPESEYVAASRLLATFASWVPGKGNVCHCCQPVTDGKAVVA